LDKLDRPLPGFIHHADGVKVIVIKTDLADKRDQEGLVKDKIIGKNIPHVKKEPQRHSNKNAQEEQEALNEIKPHSPNHLPFN
jgi:hypothetical protein